MEESKSIIIEEICSILKFKKYYDILDKNYLKLLFKLSKFKPGLIELAKIENNEQEILSIYMEDSKFELVIETCQTYSTKDRNIWIQAFSYFTNYQDQEKIETYLKTVLNTILEYNLLSPIVVLQTLRKRKYFKLDILKEYIANSMKNTIQEMANDKKNFEECYYNVKQISKKLEQHRVKPLYFNCKSCSVCKENFTQYSNGVSTISKIIVFKCRHAFHPICLNIQDRLENSSEEYSCPNCSYKYEQVNKRIQIIYDNANDHNSFFMQLSKKDNKFDFIAKHLGRGAISNITNSNL